MLEKELQANIIKYCNLKGIDAYSTLNGAWFKNDYKTLSMLKKQGLKRGVPDLIIFHRNCLYFVELKVGKNKLTPEQEYFKAKIDKLAPAPVTFLTIYSMDEFVRLFQFGRIRRL